MENLSLYGPSIIKSNSAKSIFYDDTTTNLGPHQTPPKVIEDVQSAIEALDISQGPQGAQGPKGDTPSLGGFFVGITGDTSPNNQLVAPGTFTTIKALTYPFGGNNVGSNYDSSTGVFTAPINGYYSFVASVSFLTNSSTSYREVRINENGQIGHIYALSGLTSSGTPSLVASVNHVQLSAGTEVVVSIIQNTGTSIATQALISGSYESL